MQEFSFRPEGVGINEFKPLPHLQGCSSLKEFVDASCGQDPGKLDHFHHKYVKRIKRSLESISKFVKELTELFDQCHIHNPALLKDIENIQHYSILQFSEVFEKYFTDNINLEEHQALRKKLLKKNYSEEEILQNIKSKVYESVNLSKYCPADVDHHQIISDVFRSVILGNACF